MRMPPPSTKVLPLDIVGSTQFGRYPMISIAQTFNMLISDGWLVPYAGYRNVAPIAPSGQGRGVYSGSPQTLNQMVTVFDNGVYLVNGNEAYNRIGTIDTFDGDVFIAQNNAKQIAICDKQKLYIYDYSGNTTPAFQEIPLDFTPTYIAFQAGYFIATDTEQGQWRLSDPNNGLSWPADAPNVGVFETKPDRPIAVLPFPGSSNQLMIFGSIVTQLWTNTGAQLFPYQLNTYFNIDYGCINPATISALETIVVWVGINENSGPVIMFTQGGKPIQISNDGINFRLAQLTNPTNAYGFLFKQDGHLIYQVTWPDDNLSLAYDFNTEKFLTLTDENMNYHIAKRVVFFNNKYYFVSINDGNLYELNSQYTTYDGAEIPRIRIPKTIRLPGNSRFIVNNINFSTEQGEYEDLQAIDYSFSKDNGNSFSSYRRKELSITGFRQRMINFWNSGMANNFTPQFRFYGKGRFLASNGTVSIYQ